MTDFRRLWSRLWAGAGVWILPFGFQASPYKTKQTTATVTANTCKRAQTRPFLLNLPCDNTRRSIRLNKIPVTCLCRAPASGRGIAAVHRKPMPSPRLPPASPTCAPAFLPSCISAGRQKRSCSDPAFHGAHAPLPLQKKRDFDHTHPHRAREAVGALLCRKSAALRRGTGDPSSEACLYFRALLPCIL